MAEQPGFEEAVLQRIGDGIEPLAEAMAQTLGMPPGGRTFSQAEVDAEWNYSPIADPRTRVETMLQLRDLGKTDEEITDAIYPNRRRLVAASRPKVADQIAFAQRQDRRMAQLAAQLPAPDAGMAALPEPAVPVPSAPQATAPAESPVLSDAPTPSPAPSILDQPLSLGG